MKQLPKSVHGYIVLAILAFAFLTRLYRVEIPKTYYFDEVYHAVTAKLYARNDPSGYEWWHQAPEPNTAIEWLHPPLAKLTQAVGILLFGENSFGWRISSVVFGTAVVYITYLLAKKLLDSGKAALLAAFFASLDGLLLAQSRIAMNDIHVTFFIILSFYLYLLWKQKKTRMLLLVSGISAGLAASSKWSGVFVIGIFFADQILMWLRKWKLPSLMLLVQQVVAWVAIPIIVYFLSFGQFWLQGHTWAQFRELHNQVWYYQTHLKAEHPYQSRPWQWMLDLRPVWMSVDYTVEGKVGNIYNLGNPIVFLGGLAGMVYILYSLLTKRNDGKYKTNMLFLLTAYAVIWMPWFFSPRIMFFYHYTPAVPLLSIALSLCTIAFLRKRKWKFVGALVIATALLWFAVFYPYITGIPIPAELVMSVYQRIPLWK